MMFAPLVQAQLVKDAPYAWFLFDQAKQNSRYYLPDFKEQADSVEAYLDAFVVALETGEAAETWLDSDDWGSCFVLAVLGIRLKQERFFDLALDHLKEDEETHYREIVDACLWDQSTDLAPWLIRLYQHASPVAKQTALAVARADTRPLNPDLIANYQKDEHQAVQIQLLHWLGEHRAKEHLAWIQQHYMHDNQTITFAAARAGFLLDDETAKLETYALQENAHMLEAVSLILIKENNPDILKQWLEKLWSWKEAPIRVKLYATAIAGLPEFVEKLFQPMVDEATSRAAGEAFTLFTGIDIEDADLDARAEDCCNGNDDLSDEPTLAERRQQDPFISDWEDDLPYPCPDATSQWWQSHQHQFNPGTRYLSGLEVNEKNLQDVWLNGNQRQRQLAAWHLFIKYDYHWLDCGWLHAGEGSGLGS